MPRIRGPIDVRWDGSVYYVLGTSLAEGKGYRLLNEPGQIRAIQYPPLLSAIVAVHEIVLRTNDPIVVGLWLRRSWCILSGLYIILAYLLGRLFLPQAYAFLLALLCLASYEMYFLSTLLFAELPFAFATTLFAVLYYKRPQLPAAGILAPITAVASYLLRTMGVALLVAWTADALLSKQFRRAGVRAAIALVPILLWHSYIHAVESAYEYKHPYYAYQRDAAIFPNVSYATNISLKSPFRPSLGKATARDFADRFMSNAAAALSDLGQAISSIELLWEDHLRNLNGLLRPIAIPFWTIEISLNLIGSLVLGGIVFLWLRGPRLIAMYLLFAIVMVCATPWMGQKPRYLAPTLPFIALALLFCVRQLQNHAKQLFSGYRASVASNVVLLLVLFILCESSMSLIRGLRHFRNEAVYEDKAGGEKHYWLFHHPRSFSSMELALKWLAAYANANSVVAVSMPQWVYLKTGLKTVMPPFESDPIRALELIDSVPVSYLILDRMIMESSFNNQFPALVRNSPEKWSRVYSSGNGDVEIYQRITSTANN